MRTLLAATALAAVSLGATAGLSQDRAETATGALERPDTAYTSPFFDVPEFPTAARGADNGPDLERDAPEALPDFIGTIEFGIVDPGVVEAGPEPVGPRGLPN